MPEDKYNYDDLLKDLQSLIDMGLIEIKGINDAGDWIYGPTEKSVGMSEEERAEIINKAVGDR